MPSSDNRVPTASGLGEINSGRDDGLCDRAADEPRAQGSHGAAASGMVRRAACAARHFSVSVRDDVGSCSSV